MHENTVAMVYHMTIVARVVEEMLTSGNLERSTHCRMFLFETKQV